MTRDGVQRRVAPVQAAGPGWIVWYFAWALAGGSPAAALETATGLEVVIHSADEIRAEWLVHDGGRTWLRHPVAGEVELEAEADLVPASPAVVAEALEAMHGFQTRLHVEVFLLPGFPVEESGSFARRDAIFVAPGLGERADETVAYLATHELGHVLCWAVVDGRTERWAAYRELRGLPPRDGGLATPHAERHREIIAEDFRYLFGGPLATRSGTIENANLSLPDAVTGLADLLAGFLAEPAALHADGASSRVFPNPCRERASVELTLATGAGKVARAEPVLDVYDVRGRLVRRVNGGHQVNGREIVVWDGTDARGRRAASGPYLYSIRCGDQVGTGRLMLVDR